MTPEKSNLPQDRALDAALAEGQTVDGWVRKRLADMGLEEDDIGVVVEGAGGVHALGGRWRICPRCKSNIDMLTWVEGKEDGQQWPQIMQPGEIECPNCGAYGETFGLNPMHEPHPKLKTYSAQRVHNPMPWSSKYIKIGKMLIEENGLFPSDPTFDANEPHWPRDLAACIVGSALMLVSTIKREIGPQRGPKSQGKSQGRQHGRPQDRQSGDGNRRY